MTKETTKIEELMSKLLSTLDESEFFGILTSHIGNQVNCDEIVINLVHEDNSTREVARNGKAVSGSERIAKRPGACGHVIKSKKAYFSNNIQRDPMFSKVESTMNSELCVPVMVDGVVIGTAHLRRENEEEKFERSDINTVLEALNELASPLRNMKMYLSAKFLNESLQEKIKEKESQLKKSINGLELVDTVAIKEKEIIGKSDVMINLLNTADKAAMDGISILITGETGSGKEMIARRMHCRSNRSRGAFTTMDCSMGTEEQLEAELFGSEEITVTHGLKLKKGAVEAAANGTVFINNIHKMPVRLQAKLMKFIADGIFSRVGTQTPLRSEARIIAASAVELVTCVEEGTFREDLFFALGALNLRIPALRERGTDIEVLASHFLNKGKDVSDQKSMSPGVIKLLTDYHWPGNVRELESIMQRAYILSPSSIVERDHLADSIKVEKKEETKQEEEIVGYREMTLNDLEREHICRTLEHLSGNKTKTARVLGITVKTLYNKLHSYGMIEPKEA